MGSPGGKHCESLQRNVWRGVVSPLKRSVFGHRMLHSAVILWEALVTNVGALKFQVSVWLMRKITSINTSCLRLSVKFIFTEFTQWSTWRKGLEIYSANLGINVGAHLSFLVVIKVTRPSFFEGVPSYFEALWYPQLYFYRKSNT